MKYALFLGCQIPARLQSFEAAAREVLSKALNIELIDIKEFTCCGYPVKNFDYKAFILASARNLALAEKKDLNVLTLCQCCFGSLKKAQQLIREDSTLRAWVNQILNKEKLAYNGKTEVRHFLSVLRHDVGIDAIAKKITRPFKDLKVAAHYGCHALRPSDVVAFDDPVNPSIFEKLIEVTGATNVSWSMRLECCGAPLSGVNDELAMDLTEKKIKNAQQANADYLCTACPYCQMQFDTVQDHIHLIRGGNPPLPSILYPQLLGLSMGMDPASLKIEDNRIPITPIMQFLFKN